MPSDITGTDVLEEDRATGRRVFRFVRGPMFANVDPGRRGQPHAAQDAGRAAAVDAGVPRVGRGADLRRCRCPFLVFATQNPIEQEGTYPLPEAQLDRFMFQVDVGYPSEDEEVRIVNQVTTGVPTRRCARCCRPSGSSSCRTWCCACRRRRTWSQHAVALVRARRRPGGADARPTSSASTCRGARGRARRSTWCWRPRRARSWPAATRSPSRTCARWRCRCWSTACCRTSTPRPTGSPRGRWSTGWSKPIRPA